MISKSFFSTIALFIFFRRHRTIRVWLKRDSGTYWPSIVNFMPSQCTSIGELLIELDLLRN